MSKSCYRWQAGRIGAALGLCAILSMPAAARTTQQGQQQQQNNRRAGADQITSIDERVGGLKKMDGFFPIYWDENAGRLWLEVPKLDTEVLYTMGFGAGLGSNDIGLDRGALMGSRIVRFERVGPKLLMVQPNYRFRAQTDNPAESRAVRDAFARSVIFIFPRASRTAISPVRNQPSPSIAAAVASGSLK